jgi:putative drug exporter of the RND superfamily
MKTAEPTQREEQTVMNGVGRIARIPCGRRTKWLVVLFWVLVLGVAVPLGGKLTGVQKNDSVEWLPQSAESTKVFKLSESFGTADDVPAVVVYERRSGVTPADLAAATADKAAFRTIDGVVGSKVLGPIPAKDGQALELLVPVRMGPAGWQTLTTAVKDMQTKASDRNAGLSMHVAGPAGMAAAFGEAFEGIDGTLLFSAVGVVVFILLLTYRSPILWLFPVIAAGVALISAEGVIYLFVEHAGLTVNAQSAGVLTVLVFGAGTDYALLLVARYREELRRHADRHDAMAVALHRAGPAVFASASTVVIGMLALVVAQMNSTKGMGPVAAIGIAVGLLAMLTLLPALLVIAGRWLFWPVRPTMGSEDHTETGVWARVGRRIARRPRAVWVVTTLVLLGLALGLAQLKTEGIANNDAFIGKTDAVSGDQAIARHFDAGTGQPVVVVAKAAASTEVASALRGTSGIGAVSQPVVKNGLTYLEGTLTDRPDGRAAEATVDRVRAAVHRVDGAEAVVGGGTAVALDIKRASSHDNKVIIPVVLVLVFLVLTLLLRSVVAPVLLVATVVLSFLAALGISALFFTHVFGFKGGDPGLALLAFVFLVALGIDYNIFLMSRVHEESKRSGTRRGALTGLAATGGVITSAGLVLAGTFAVFATLPIVSFAQMGFVVSVGVLLDTLIVRSVLVTALNLDIAVGCGGRASWRTSATSRWSHWPMSRRSRPSADRSR